MIPAIFEIGPIFWAIRGIYFGAWANVAATMINGIDIPRE